LPALGVRRLVLQPQTEVARLRRWLAECGFAVVAEVGAVERGRTYSVLVADAAPPATPALSRRGDSRSIMDRRPVPGPEPGARHFRGLKKDRR
jgi:hypothetical protein